MDIQLKRPAYAEIRDLLKSCDGLIVHFSTSPSMHAEQDGHYPQDLHTALTNPYCRSGGLSCSVVTPHDPYTGDSRFVPGYIGIILDPKRSHSIVSCSTDDGGDCRIPDTCKVMGERENVDISVDDLRRTICERTGYNNWLVRDYEVCGILALPPFEAEMMRYHESTGQVRVTKKTKTSEVASEFSGYSVYTVKHNRYHMFTAAGACEEVEYDSIWQNTLNC
jgi:hypothetical protein